MELLTHGTGRELVAPAWPPLTDEEVTDVLVELGPGGGNPHHGARMLWRSPRPTSAAALAQWGETAVVVKRHHRLVREPGQLGAEHALATYLRSVGQPVPAVLRSADGASVVGRGDYFYEAHERAPGHDLYRDTLSWAPFAHLGHARAAGMALGRLHLAAEGFSAPARPFAVLMNTTEVITAEDPIGAIERLSATRPGLQRALQGRLDRRHLARLLCPLAERAKPLLAPLPSCWGHGDWHASNLTWSNGPHGQVCGVIDLGLSNRTFAMHDLALAIERNCVDWLDLDGKGRVSARSEMAIALVEGYLSTRPLSQDETLALPALLPLCHVEHALSEVEYFARVVGSATDTDQAYHNYLTGHMAWFTGPEGQALTAQVARAVAGRG